MQSGRGKLFLLFVFVGGIVGFFVFGKGACTQAVDAVDTVTDGLTGNQAIRVGSDMENQIRQIQSDRNAQLEGLDNR